jgi:hypothetical protein
MHGKQLTCPLRDPHPLDASLTGALLLVALTACATHEQQSDDSARVDATEQAGSRAADAPALPKSAGGASGAAETGLPGGRGAASAASGLAASVSGGASAPTAANPSAADGGAPVVLANSAAGSSGAGHGAAGGAAGPALAGTGVPNAGGGAGAAGIPGNLAAQTGGALAPIPCVTAAECNASTVDILALTPLCDSASATCVGCPTKAQHDAHAAHVIACVSATILSGCMTEKCLMACQSACN